MKKNLFFLLLLANSHAGSSQITVDNVYQGASQKLYMVNLETSGMKYVVKSDAANNRYINLYHLNHSLWKTINCNAMPTTTYSSPSGVNTIYNFDAIAISQKIFDCDSLIEFMYVSVAPSKWFTGIYNENGVAKLIADSMAPLVKINVPNQFLPLYNTPSGSKLILSHNSGKAVVYNLPCTITNTTVLTGISASSISDPTSMSVYPNPSQGGLSTISYHLPQGSKQGQIVIYDLLGREAKRYTVDNNFSELLLSDNELPPGTYVYSLLTNGKVVESKKVIIN
jgi:hypothetical protein